MHERDGLALSIGRSANAVGRPGLELPSMYCVMYVCMYVGRSSTSGKSINHKQNPQESTKHGEEEGGVRGWEAVSIEGEERRRL